MCSDGDVVLMDGPEDRKDYEGRLEICRGGQWGSLCDHNINNATAIVVCKQLNQTSPGEKDRCLGSSEIVFD